MFKLTQVKRLCLPGDVSQKPFVSSDADVVQVELDGDEDYVVLGCDGVWDVVQAAAIPAIVHRHVAHRSRHGVARAIVSHARDCGSSDNISVVVVFLRDEIAPPQGNPLPAAENGTNSYTVFSFGDGKASGGGSDDTSDDTGLNNGTGDASVLHRGKTSKEGWSYVVERLRTTTSENSCCHGDGRNEALMNANKAASKELSSLSSQVWGSAVSTYSHDNNGCFVGKKKRTNVLDNDKCGTRRTVKLP